MMTDAIPASDALSMWTIYDHPADLDAAFVARRWEVRNSTTTATSDVIASDSLDALREEMLFRGLTCITRSPEDDAKIVESWL